ncbi:unnamed protein product, partial [Iphiclides podalirius]
MCEKTFAQIESSHKTLKRMERGASFPNNDGITEIAKPQEASGGRNTEIRSSDHTAVNLATEMGIATKPEGKPKPFLRQSGGHSTTSKTQPHAYSVIRQTRKKTGGETSLTLYGKPSGHKNNGCQGGKGEEGKARNQKIVLSCGSKHDLEPNNVVCGKMAEK